MHYKAVILAAGLGTRLKPWTNFLPKALFPFFDVSILERLVRLLESHQIYDIALNAHHHAEKIIAFAKERKGRSKIFVSHETPEILGSGGAFPPLEKWREQKDIIVINGDVVTDLNVAQLIALHEQENAHVTMTGLTKPLERSDRFLVCHGHKLKKISGAGNTLKAHESAHGNAGISIYSNKFLQKIPAGKSSSIIDAIEQSLVENEKVCVFRHRGFWHSLDDKERFLAAQKDYFSRLPSDPFRVFDTEKLHTDKNNNFVLGHNIRLIKGEEYSFRDVMIFGDGVLKPGHYDHQVIMLNGDHIVQG